MRIRRLEAVFVAVVFPTISFAATSAPAPSGTPVPKLSGASAVVNPAPANSVLAKLATDALQAAGSPASGSPISLQDAVAAAMRVNETTKTQLESVYQADQTYKQAFGSILPSISLNGQNQWQQVPTNSLSSAFFPPSQPLADIALTQPIFRGTSEYAALRETRDQVQNQAETWKNDVIALYRDVALQFYTVASIENDMKNLRTEIDLNYQWIAELEKRIKIGRSQLTDKLTEQVNAETLMAQLETLDEQLAVARENLAIDTGLPSDIPVVDVKTLPESVPALGDYLVLTDDRPDVKAALAADVASQENVQVQWGANLPSVNLTADYYLTRAGALSSVQWDATLSASLPIFQGGVIESKVRQAASQERQADLAVERTRRAAWQDIRTWHASFLSDLAQIQALQRAVLDGEKNYKAMMNNYRLGLNTNIDVLTALTAFCEDKRALDKSRYQAKLDYARLESSVAREPGPSDLSLPKF